MAPLRAPPRSWGNRPWLTPQPSLLRAASSSPLIGIGAAGFAVGCTVGGSEAAGPVTLTSLGDYVRVGSDNTITVYLRHIEFGQGVSTGLTTIVAEEIDADWSQMRFEHSPADNAKYGNPAFGGMMGTGGSTAIFSSWQQLRAAGASAREMLRQAAAKKFGVDASEVLLVKGKAEAGGKSATYGELAAEAAKITPPDAEVAAIQGPGRLRIHRQGARCGERLWPSRHAGQGARQGAIRARLSSRRHADRPARPQPEIRRQGRQLR